MLNFIL